MEQTSLPARKGQKRPKQGDYHIYNCDKKVTIILLISVRLSYNKVDKDLYNPNWITCLKFFSALSGVTKL